MEVDEHMQLELYGFCFALVFLFLFSFVFLFSSVFLFRFVIASPFHSAEPRARQNPEIPGKFTFCWIAALLNAPTNANRISIEILCATKLSINFDHAPQQETDTIPKRRVPDYFLWSGKFYSLGMV